MRTTAAPTARRSSSSTTGERPFSSMRNAQQLYFVPAHSTGALGRRGLDEWDESEPSTPVEKPSRRSRRSSQPQEEVRIRQRCLVWAVLLSAGWIAHSRCLGRRGSPAAAVARRRRRRTARPRANPGESRRVGSWLLGVPGLSSVWPCSGLAGGRKARAAAGAAGRRRRGQGPSDHLV